MTIETVLKLIEKLSFRESFLIRTLNVTNDFDNYRKEMNEIREESLYLQKLALELNPEIIL